MNTTSEMQLVPIDKLIPYVNNARTHSPEQLNKLRSSLREFGFINPVIIDRDFNVIAGHGRILAAKSENISEVPCVFVDYLTPAQKKAYIIAEKYNIKTTLLCDTNHVLYSDYSEVIVVGAGADAVDYKLINLCHRGDIVVSQDYGVAAMALSKAAYAIHQSGRWYTDENIDRMLMERHLNKKARRNSHKNYIKGPKKRTEEDDERFAQSFEKMILMAKSKED